MRKWYNRKAVAKIAEISRKNKFEKTSEKGLTKEFGCDIIEKLVWKRNSGHKKVFWKNLKKNLTKNFECDIILKLSRKRERYRKENLKKLLKRGLTNELECGIIKNLITKVSNSILKIKQCKKYNDPWDSDERIGRSRKDFKTQ